MNINEWNEIIDKFIVDENKSIGEQFPSYRIFDSRAQLTGAKGIGLYNTFVTEDLIGRFARALGDPNPLYSDSVYARESSLGNVVAPPVFEGCIASTVLKGNFPRLRGMRMMDGGTKWEKIRHIVPGDELHGYVTFDGFTDITKEDRPYRLLAKKSTIVLLDKEDKPVSKICPTTLIKCMAPDSEVPAGVKPKKEQQEKTLFSEDELNKLYANLDAQINGDFIRGEKKLYWEDVNVGDKLPEIMVGPYDDADARSFMAAVGVANAFATKWNAIKGQINRAPKDPETGAYRLPMDWHMSDSVARQLGQPKALIFGLHTQALLGYAVGSYMGNDGFLKSISCKNVKTAFFGDILTQGGEIIDKYIENGEKLVKIRLTGTRHTGITYIEGEAVVMLPSKE